MHTISVAAGVVSVVPIALAFALGVGTFLVFTALIIRSQWLSETPAGASAIPRHKRATEGERRGTRDVALRSMFGGLRPPRFEPQRLRYALPMPYASRARVLTTGP